MTTLDNPIDHSISQQTFTGVYPSLPIYASPPEELSMRGCLWLDEYVYYSSQAVPECQGSIHAAYGAWLLAVVAEKGVQGGPLQLFVPSSIVGIEAYNVLFEHARAEQVALEVLREAELDGLVADRAGSSDLALLERRVMAPQIAQQLQAWHQRLARSKRTSGIMEDEVESYEPYYKRGMPRYCAVEEVRTACTIYRDALYEIARDMDWLDLDDFYALLPDNAMKLAALFASLAQTEQIELRHWAKAQAVAEMMRRSVQTYYNRLCLEQV